MKCFCQKRLVKLLLQSYLLELQIRIQSSANTRLNVHRALDVRFGRDYTSLYSRFALALEAIIVSVALLFSEGEVRNVVRCGERESCSF